MKRFITFSLCLAALSAQTAFGESSRNEPTRFEKFKTAVKYHKKQFIAGAVTGAIGGMVGAAAAANIIAKPEQTKAIINMISKTLLNRELFERQTPKYIGHVIALWNGFSNMQFVKKGCSYVGSATNSSLAKSGYSMLSYAMNNSAAQTVANVCSNAWNIQIFKDTRDASLYLAQKTAKIASDILQD